MDCLHPLSMTCLLATSQPHVEALRKGQLATLVETVDALERASNTSHAWLLALDTASVTQQAHMPKHICQPGHTMHGHEHVGGAHKQGIVHGGITLVLDRRTCT